MRIKSDFITNSSSASFLVAIKHGTTKDALKEILAPSVKRYFDYSLNEEYFMRDFRDETDLLKTAPVTEEDLLDFIASSILGDVKSGMELGDWTAIAREYGSEDSGVFSNFMYSFFNARDANPEIIKVDSYC